MGYKDFLILIKWFEKERTSEEWKSIVQNLATVNPDAVFAEFYHLDKTDLDEKIETYLLNDRRGSAIDAYKVEMNASILEAITHVDMIKTMIFPKD